MKIKYYILSFFIFWTSIVFAQDVKFTASASKNEVGTGEQFEITFAINGNGDRFSPPDMSAFQVLGGPNVSTSMESINGNTTVSNSFSYDLLALKEGEFTIGPASIVVNGHRLSTNSIRIKVVKGRPVTRSNHNGSAIDAVVADGKPADLSKSLLLRAVVDKDNVYQGQQLTLTYRLYTRVGIVQSQVDKLPDLTGFWNEDVKNEQQQVQWRTETYKGLKYNVADIKQIILFPEHAGNITIDPFAMTFVAREQVPSNDPMANFFGGAYQDIKYSAKSTPLTIHVRPLPDNGKPVSFADAVGDFTIEANLDKNRLKANEALNYKVKVTGSGNIKLLKILNVDFPADFEKYDPKIVDTVTEKVSGVSGSRIYNYLLIPRHEGDFTINPVKFSYFNPATGRYVSLSTRAFQVKVDKGIAENNITAFSNADKQDIKVLDKDIRYIKTGDLGLYKEGDRFYGSIGYWLLLVLGPLVCITAFVYRNWQQKANRDLVKVKSRRAGKLAAKHLANAQKQLLTHDTKTFYEAIFKGLYGYLSNKLNISSADLNKETIASILRSKAVSDQLITRLLDTLDLCEMARYAPVTHISEQEVFEKAKNIINQIENEI
jgi:hypothetical protein